ncbi:cytochrome aa3 quinol oxidase subunit II [Bacillus sp. IB182487]|uniref:Quinol oxidase subunit 2 n=2 Tax=Metabacillus arenae TaxID=2771434 RepID=A0A926NAE2_9BACI|nr:cytochrome aa3 quinol oxidase subunit II [Metabacillus arenae]
MLLVMMTSVFILGGCSELVVLDPKGPVAAQQRDLILLSIWAMLFIIIVVFVLFTIVVVKYRERKENKDYEPPEMEGSTKLEIIWTVIPILIVIGLSIPTVQTIYSLEEAPKSSNDKEPLVIHATSVNWKWVFSYPEEGIETVNYLHIPEDRAVLFRLTSADSMAAFWVPQLGGQKYNMAGMETKLYLQADEPGTYQGRNANFTGEGFSNHRFDVIAQTEGEFEDWVEETQGSAPKLTEEQYEKLMLPGEAKEMEFSSTHLEFVNHAEDAEYAIKVREKYGVTSDPHGKKEDQKNETENDSDNHENHEEASHSESHSH